MSDLEHLIYWEELVSPHMVPLLAEVSHHGLQVTYVAPQFMQPDREKMGWNPTTDKRVEIRIIDNDIPAIVRKYPDDIHIVAGVVFSGIMGHVRHAMSHQGKRWGAILETVDERSRLWAFVKRGIYKARLTNKKRRPDFILAMGAKTRQWIIDRGYPAERVFPFSYFLPQSGSPARTRSDGPFRIGFVGRLISLKRVDVLISALAGLSDCEFELVIVGDGPLKAQIKQLALEQLGANKFTMLGMISMQEVSEVMAGFDCLVLPSDYDGWGAVVTEALMAGVPAISSDACGALEAVNASGVGGVFPAGNVVALRNLLREEIGKGPMDFHARQQLSNWAQCLGAKAGAKYLSQILCSLYSNGVRPEPPWSS